MPDSYCGAQWPEYYVFLSQNRESDSLTRSNFICGLKVLGGESETVFVVPESHWAVGWVEWIAIHESDTKALASAEVMLKKIEGYPVLNEEHFSNLQWDEANNYWASLSICERVEMCQDANVCIFSARRDYIPQDDSGYIFERCSA